MKTRALFSLAVLAAFFAPYLPAPARTLPQMQIVTPAYTLTCAPTMRGKVVLLRCSPSRTPKAVTENLFGSWSYGDPMPRAILAQVVGNGGPAICDGTTIVCTNGVVALNTAGSLANSSIVCTNSSGVITTTGCPSGGDTITTPNGSLTVGGTSSATTLDINVAHTNEYTAQQHWDGAGGANACAGTNYPATAYGICVGANNGTTNVDGIVVGPSRTDFACTASCTAGDSAHIRFYDSAASGAVSACDLHYNQSVGAMSATCPLIISGRLLTTANATGGTCTPSSATSCTVTLGHTFGAPVCATSINTATAANVVPVAWSVSGTTLTLTTAAAGSTPLSGWCWGNGS